MSQILKQAGDALVIVGSQNGLTVIPSPTPLTRLNYFDGKFLRADDLQREQQYLRSLVQLSNQAGGAGVVHGFDITRSSGDTLHLGPGLAIDPAGRVLLLPHPTTASIGALIEASRARATAVDRAPPASASRIRTAAFGDCEVEAATPPSTVTRGSDLYLIAIAHAEALCGEEDVYGKLCEDACATSTDRPYRVEGLVLRALPLTLRTPLATSGAVALDRRHLRSLVASAFYADERAEIGNLVSRAGLALDTWCRGALAAGGSDVPLGVLAYAGSSTIFLDAWIARRERIEAPPKRYWAARMMMRPWDVYLAQILQFQCQLHEVLRGTPDPGGDDDPCRDSRQVLDEASAYLAEVQELYVRHIGDRPEIDVPAEAEPLFQLPGGTARIAALKTRVITTLQGIFAGPRDRVLIGGGVVELPPAGYLPVVPGTNVSVNTQVHRLLGEGVDLRFCVVRPDFVAHALEEAQHMERISLLQGLDDPARRPEVDVLVPDGEISGASRAQRGQGWEVRFSPSSLSTGLASGERPTTPRSVLHGAGRSEPLPAGGAAFHFAGVTETVDDGLFVTITREVEAAEGELDLSDMVRRATRGAAGAEDRETGARTTRTSDIRVGESPLDLDPAFLSRLRLRADEARRVAAMRRAAASGFAAEQPRTEDDGAALESTAAALAVRQPAVSAVWTSMQCTADPFALSAGERMAVNLRVVLSAAGQAAGFYDTRLNGFFTVEEPGSPASARRVVGRLSGDSIVHRSGDDPPVGSTIRPFDRMVTLQRSTSAEGVPSLEIQLSLAERISITLTTSWRGRPVRARLVVRLRSGDQDREIPIATADENPEVLSPGNRIHEASVAALAVLDAALTPLEPEFDVNATRLLFPPPPAAQESLIVRATRDWVLFHRRRSKRCGEEEVRPAPPATRRYQVFHLLAEGRDVAQLVRRVLTGGLELPDDLSFTDVDVVEFAGGTSTLATPGGAIVQDWAAIRHGDLLLYGAVASQDADPVETNLARPRLLRLQAALAGILTPDPQIVNDVVTALPTALRRPGTDGSIVLVSTGSVRTECHTVFRVDNQDAFERLLRLISAGQLGGSIEQFASRLGDVEFTAGTDAIRDDSADTVIEAWDEAGGGAIAAALAVLAPGESDANLRTQQATAIARAVGTATQVRPLPSPTPLPTDCAALTVLLAQPQATRTARLVPHTGPDDDRSIAAINDDPRVEFAPDGTLEGDRLPDEVVRQLRVFLRGTVGAAFTRVALATRETPADANANRRLEAIFRALEEAGMLARDENGNTAASSGLTTVREPERDLFTVRDMAVDDLVFLQFEAIG